MITDHTWSSCCTWPGSASTSTATLMAMPDSDKAGPKPPQRAYLLSLRRSRRTRPAEPPKRFMMGGNIYTSWATVPDQFKGYDSNRPDPARSTASIFHVQVVGGRVAGSRVRGLAGDTQRQPVLGLCLLPLSFAGFPEPRNPVLSYRKNLFRRLHRRALTRACPAFSRGRRASSRRPGGRRRERAASTPDGRRCPPRCRPPRTRSTEGPPVPARWSCCSAFPTALGRAGGMSNVIHDARETASEPHRRTPQRFQR